MAEIKEKALLKFLMVPILYELIIGGSGRIFEVGLVTMRMIFFSIALLFSIFHYGRTRKINKTISNFLFYFNFLLFLGISIGMLKGSSIDLLFEDVKAISFFLIIVFFGIVIDNLDDIDKVVTIIKRGSLILGLAYLVIILLLFTNKLDFVYFYESQSENGEIFFRTDIFFFYKGFLYLCIGFFFFILSNGVNNKIGAAILYLSICLTLTRGFILFTTLILGYYILFVNKKIIPKIAVTSIALALSIYALPMLFSEVGDRSDGDTSRFIQIDQVIQDINGFSFFLGHGFGHGTVIRPVHMEISFLEIFHKQGLLGLIFWFSILIYIYVTYKKIKIKCLKEKALPFLLSTVFVYMQSFTNPFINNSIGMSVTILSLIVITKLVEIQSKEMDAPIKNGV